MDYTSFGVEDFVSDEYFIKWVKAPTEESDRFWQSWLSGNPDKRTMVAKAREIILLLDIEEKYPPEGKFLEIWEQVIRSDDSHQLPKNPQMHLSHRKPPNSGEGSHIKKVHGKWLFGKWAAALIFFSLFSYLLYKLVSDYRVTTVRTAYGESTTFFLPDSTKVTLNYNSKLEYVNDWQGKDVREVWLSGEAFFSVVHRPDHQKFLVNTNELQIEVLGTQFNVNSRRGNTKVVLDEGKVRLNLEDERPEQELIMEPGDLIAYSGDNKNLTREVVNPEDYISWRNNKLTFIATPFSEIAQLLEDNYGLKVVFRTPDLKNKKFTGSTAADNVNELLEKLSLLFDLRIIKKKNQIIIEEKIENPE